MGMQEGSFPLGFLAGFFGGCIGAVLVQILAKGKSTKNGAWTGFAVAVVLSIVTSVMLVAVGA
jgi:uncharacterized membrane protein YsdA (DUF1294 family)